jgi:hypothetical protein
LANRIQTRATQSMVLSALDNLADDEAYTSKESNWSLTNHRTTLQSQLAKLKPAQKGQAQDQEPLHSPTQIISCLETMDRYGNKRSLFSRDELALIVDIYHTARDTW